MGKILAHPIVSRLLGALGAGGTTYLVTHDWKSAATTASTFLIYGAAHTAASSAGP